MQLNREMRRALKYAAISATLISVPPGALWLTQRFYESGVVDAISVVLLFPGELVNALAYDHFPKLSMEAAPYLATVSSWLIYFGFIFVMLYSRYATSKSQGAPKPETL